MAANQRRAPRFSAASADAVPKKSISARALAVPAAPYLADLNPEQRAAVEAVDGPVLVLAGAGTGKTRVLTTRIAHILCTGRARASEILAVTFTNKAAREMKERIGALVGGAVEGMPWLGTFHAIGVKILRRHAELVGLKSGFTILDTDDQIRLIKQVIESEGLDKDRWPARQLAPSSTAGRTAGLRQTRCRVARPSPSPRARAPRSMPPTRSGSRSSTPPTSAICCWRCCGCSSTIPDVLALYQRRFRYTLVDEYQDTNVAQYLWLRLIAGGSPNICCVGDDDQSIYGWRGAEVDNILRFEKDFPGAKVIRLERNYRSKGHILAAASGLIAHNKGRLGKTLFTDDDTGSPVAVFGVWDDEEEARTIGDDIEALHKAGQRLDQHRHPGAGLVPDARLRGSLRHPRAALPRRRRPALLRAPGDQGRHRLPGGHSQPGQRFEVRAHRQRAQARPRRHRREARQRIGSGARRIALSSRPRDRRDRGADGKGKKVALRSRSPPSSAGAAASTA